MNKYYVVKHPKKKWWWSGLEWTNEKRDARVFTKQGAETLVNKRWYKGVRKTVNVSKGYNKVIKYAYLPQPKIKELKNTKRMAG